MLKWRVIGNKQIKQQLSQALVHEAAAELSDGEADCLYIAKKFPDLDVREAFAHDQCVLLDEMALLTPAQLKDLCEQAKESNLLLMYADRLHYAMISEIIEEHIKEQIIGRLIRFDITYANRRDLLSALSLTRRLLREFPHDHDVKIRLHYGGHQMVIEGENGSFTIPDLLKPDSCILKTGDEELVCTTPDRSLERIIDAFHHHLAFLHYEDETYSFSHMISLREAIDHLPVVMGLTGGIATGKSTVSTYLRSQNIPVIDADQISHQALKSDSPVFQTIVDRFDCLDENGGISRAKLGAIVFDDAKERAALEAIIHPYVKETILARIQEAKGLIVLDVPLLYEVHFDVFCDFVCVVTCDEEMQFARLKARNQLSDEEARKRMQAQMPLKDKCERADYLLDNSGDLDNLYRQIEAMMKEVEL